MRPLMKRDKIAIMVITLGMVLFASFYAIQFDTLSSTSNQTDFNQTPLILCLFLCSLIHLTGTQSNWMVDRKSLWKSRDLGKTVASPLIGTDYGVHQGVGARCNLDYDEIKKKSTILSYYYLI